MNKKAQEIGLAHSHFENSDGLESAGHMMTARDILILAERIYADFPEYYHYFGEKEFTFNNIKQGNRNPLLYKDIGVDGLKTGHLTVSGFGLVASAKQGDRRIFMVAHGMDSMQSRSDEATKLIEWAFQSFQNVKLAKAGDQLEQAPVWYGEADAVALTVAKDLVVTLPKGNQERSRPRRCSRGRCRRRSPPASRSASWSSPPAAAPPRCRWWRRRQSIGSASSVTSSRR